jgi:hypothetical protein
VNDSKIQLPIKQSGEPARALRLGLARTKKPLRSPGAALRI